MPVKRLLKFFVLSGLLGAVLGLGISFYRFSKQPALDAQKPNIVVLSFCSLRKAELSQFGAPGENLTPNLQKLFNQSYVFDQAYSRYGWTNPSLYMMTQLEPRFFEEHGYELVGTEALGRLFRIPSDVVHVGPTEPPQKDFVQLFDMPLAYLRYLWALPRLKPFYSYVHVKYMHYPYIDRVNKTARWDRFLTPAEKERVETLLKDHKSTASLPLKLVLSGDPTYLNRKNFYDIYGLFSDEGTLTKWKAEPTYAEDLAIIKKVYRSKLADFDIYFGDLFKLFELPGLAQNTVIIFTGDHGEAMMEHDRLGHANDVYDETITFPLAVHFPHTSLKEPVKIEKQFFQGSMTDMIRGLVDGSLNEKNFLEKTTSYPKNEMIISRNCANTEQSVRWQNKWKYIESASATEKLFDLEKDPGETKNVIEQNSAIATKMKFYLIDHAAEFSSVVDFSPCKQTT